MSCQATNCGCVRHAARHTLSVVLERACTRTPARATEETDARVAELPLDRMAPLDPESPISPARGEHRGEHHDELERVIRDRG
jgi:hypothetical protein